MRKVLVGVLLGASLSGVMFAAGFDISMSGSDKGISGFTMSVGDYYRAPVEEIRVVRRAIPADEMSVVYYLARKSGKHPEYIAKMRANGRSWWDIAIALKLDPRAVYIANAPRGHAYGHYKNKKHLQDVEIVEIVNTRFLADYHKVSADDIYDRRKGGRDYADIDDDYRDKKGKGDHDKRDKHERHGNGEHGKGHNKD